MTLFLLFCRKTIICKKFDVILAKDEAEIETHFVVDFCLVLFNIKNDDKL